MLASSPVTANGSTTTGVVVVEIPDGQIQVPVPTKSGISLFKAIDLVGYEIFYVGSVAQNTSGSPITKLFGTIKPVTTTNSAGLTVTGVVEAATTSGSITSLVPLSLIPILSPTPPSYAFQSNNSPIVNLGQIFTREDGSISTAIILYGVSTSRIATVNSRGSTIFETVGLFTRSNGSVATNALAFVTDSASLTLSTPAVIESSPTASIVTGYSSATGASATRNASRNASMNDTARSDPTSINPVMSAHSSSRNSNSLPNAQSSSFSTSNQTNSSRLVETSSATSHVANASVSATSSLNLLGTTIISSIGQAGLSPSTTTGANTTNTTVAGVLLLVAQSDAALAEGLTVALLAQQVPTITTIPPGLVVQIITTSTKCSHAFAMATTTSSGSTTTTVVPKICHDDAAFLLFAGAAIPQLCKVKLSLLGFLLRWICDPKSGALVGVDDITPGTISGADSVEGTTSDPNDEPTNSRGSTDRVSSTSFLSTGSLSTNHPSSTMTASALSSTVTASATSSTITPSASSSTMTASTSSAVASPYYLFSGVGDEDAVSDLLGELNSTYKALQPAVGSTPVSGADWVNLNLTANEVANLSLNSEVLLLAPYINLTESTTVASNVFTTSASFSTLSSYSSATLSATSTYSASSETSSSPGSSEAKIRRHSPYHRSFEDESSPHGHNISERNSIAKRDPGIGILAQYGSSRGIPCPRDLAVISWAPRVPAVSNNPYIFLQSQGEGTWVFLVSSGIASKHVVSKNFPAVNYVCEKLGIINKFSNPGFQG